jgi:hypothetical protein
MRVDNVPMECKVPRTTLAQHRMTHDGDIKSRRRATNFLVPLPEDR